jgi:LacI family transcriptional regulator
MGTFRTDIPRVSVFLMNAYTTHRKMLYGILDYTRGHTPWAIDLRTGRRDEAYLADSEWSSCNGLITTEAWPELLRRIRRYRLPVVLVHSDYASVFPGCVLRCDNRPIGETAAAHLLSKQCAAYAFIDVPGMSWSRERGDVYAAAVERAGAQCYRWRVSSGKALTRRIAAAPKPLGVFATDDVRAREVLNACRMADCAVPDDVAILGVDDDETLCEMSNPTLSSIPLSTQEAGFRAAEILDCAMRGEIKPEEMPDAIYTGTTVTERQSTARSFARDALVRRCRDLLAANLTARIRVPDLAKVLHVSRRTLETRFREVTGSTVASELLRLRIERAKKLLATSDRSQEKIAEACGFCDASHLGAVFRRNLGCPPSAFRKS